MFEEKKELDFNKVEEMPQKQEMDFNSPDQAPKGVEKDFNLPEQKQEETKPSFSMQTKIDREMKSAFDSAHNLDSLRSHAQKNNLSFERTLLNNMKENPEKYNDIRIGNKRYVRNGNGFDFYENGKHYATGTFNSVASDINKYYDEVESMMKK